MTTLSGKSPASTFQQLLKTEPAVNGTTLRTVEAGDGTQTPLQLSTNKVKIVGPLEVTGALTTSNVSTFDIVGPSPIINVTANVGNNTAINLGDSADEDNGNISYNNTSNQMLFEVAGQTGVPALRLSSTHLDTDKVIRTTSMLTGLDTSTATVINAAVYIHVYTLAPVSPDKVTLPPAPAVGDTYIVSNSGTANAFNISSSVGPGEINGVAGSQSLPIATTRTYICIDATNKHWISIG